MAGRAPAGRACAARTPGAGPRKGANRVQPHRPFRPSRRDPRRQRCYVVRMPFFDVQKKLEHGTSNPVTARLTLQTVELLERSTLPKETIQTIVALCVTSLAPKLLRCWEIKERL